ncbi:MAG TPA: thioredoxin family protein [Bacteroidales bacterium]|nr:thioredoxin family protein [Bacteroidales bacterium]
MIIFITSSCGQNSNRTDRIKIAKESVDENQTIDKIFKVTFIELGSVRCIPCQQMQTVMKSIAAKYSKEVKIEFHDVWTEAGKPFGVKYGIEAIPTQLFLDETGKEYYRHVGFFPEEELVKILQMKGVKLN